MYRKGQLSVRRKNECRKRQADLQEATTCASRCSSPIQVSIPLEAVSVLSVSIRSLIRSPLHHDQLKYQLKHTIVLPQGMHNFNEKSLCLVTALLYMYMYMPYFTDWISINLSYSLIQRDKDGIIWIMCSVVLTNFIQ